LEDDFWPFFVHGESEFVFLGVEKGVGLGRELPVLLDEDRFQLGRLRCGERGGVEGEGFVRHDEGE